MIIKFQCPGCRKEAPVQVPDRARALDVALWIDRGVSPRVHEAHKFLSPDCTADKFNLLIPIDNETPFVGGKVSDEAAEALKNVKFPEEE